MARYIEAEKLCKALRDMAFYQNPYKQSTILGVVESIEQFPTADVAPRAEVAKEILEKAASKFAGHSDYHGDTILQVLYCMAEGKEVNNAKPLSAKQSEGEWKSGMTMYGAWGYSCSLCGAAFFGKNAELIAKEHNYCLKCGAKMKYIASVKEQLKMAEKLEELVKKEQNERKNL